MMTFFYQLRWQLLLLQKNNIIGISFAVTLIYGILLFSLKSLGNLDKLLVFLLLNDPTVIGYFFIALAIYSEIKHEILPAIFVSPLSIHQFLISKTIAISIIGAVCALGLALPVKGFDFNMLTYSTGAFGLCIISALLGLIMLTFANEFLKFAMLSIPVFLIFMGVPVLQYLGVVELGMVKYIFPIQGSIDLIDNAISGTDINFWYSYVSLIVVLPAFYFLAFRLFTTKIVFR